MGKPLSMDLREWAFVAVWGGMSGRAATMRFGVSAREAWFDGQLDLDTETPIFVDETGASTRWHAGTAARLVASGSVWRCPTATG